MFYSSDLLIFKKGKFSSVWLAATRGGKFVSKRDLISVNIKRSCSEIMELLSFHQRPRVSLYLSSQLTFGLCVLYNRKIDRLLNDLKDLYKRSYSNTACEISVQRNYDENIINLLEETLIHSNNNCNNSLIKENQINLENQFNYLNQARYEDITMIDFDFHIENKNIENDLEPLSIDVLNEVYETRNEVDEHNLKLNNHEEVKTNNIRSPLIENPHYKNKISRVTEDLFINNFPDMKFKKTRKRCYCHELIVDKVKTIGHQTIRENMIKNDFFIIDRNSIFPNPKISKSIKYHIATSANNLFRFPGRYEVISAPKLLSFWTKRFKIAQSDKLRVKQLSNNILENKNLSIEKFREANSSIGCANIDSFNLGSDSLQKSIRQSGLDSEKINDDLIMDNLASINNNDVKQFENTVLPVIEEDGVINDNIIVNNKDDVWRLISQKLNCKLKDTGKLEETFVSFFDVCPKGMSKKVASMIFITLLRLGKYKKITLKQDNFLSCLYIGFQKE